jgi:hypothetical protein
MISRAAARLARLAAFAALLADFAHAAATPAPNVGEILYRDGVLPTGQPLRAVRGANVTLEGRRAACVSCHRRSGLGSVEGPSTIPPITGPYLFHSPAQSAEELDLPYVEGMRAARNPYSEATLARAIREGTAADGRPLSYLMPHYDLDEATMTALIGYLKSMSKDSVPGVTDSVLHFATILTPDADPVKKQGVLNVLQQYFTDKNATAKAVTPRLRSAHKMMWRVVRKWQLHVWELTGPPSTWEAQLQARLAAEPVFAIISGLGGRTWAPVQQFCEHAAIPCLFPNVEAPVIAESDFYTMYFTKGVSLEAQLIGRALETANAGSPPRRVVQVLRAGDVGEEGAKSLAATLTLGMPSVIHTLRGRPTPKELAAALGDAGAGDALVLWLRPEEIRALGAPPAASSVWMSGLMADLEHAPLPDTWRTAVHMAYPFDLPPARRVRVDYSLGWFRIRAVPIVSLQVQADTYLACGLLSETLNHMVDTFQRDYLLERIEGTLEHRILTGYYPRLALAPDQRFASKGGYVVHFTAAAPTQPVADGEWAAP